VATTTIQFNNGNPFSVGPSGVHSASRPLPATVSQATIQLLDPNGDWVDPANAGGTFTYGIEYSPDGGTTWNTLISNGTGQPVGSLTRQGALPSLTITRTTGITEAFGMPCRAFAQCDHTITIVAQAVVST
jgi:hypothetical protein